MTADPIGVPPEVTVGAFIEDYVYRRHHRLFPVVRGGELLGQVGTPQAAAVDRALWPVTAVAQIMLPVTAADVVSPDLDVLAALNRMQRAGRSRLFVVQGRTLLGIVTLRDMLELLSARLELDPARGTSPPLWPGAVYGEPQERFKP